MKTYSVDPYSDFVINEYESLRSAMQSITRNRRRCIFVINDRTELLGVLTDGDIRRAILCGTPLTVCVGDACNKAVKYIVDDGAPDLPDRSTEVFLKHPDIDAIPVVNTKLILTHVICRLS